MINFDFSLTVTPTYCNTWPWLQIVCGQTILYDGLIEYKQTLNFKVTSVAKSCCISLIGIKKQNDTVVGPSGELLEDKSLCVDAISIDGINMDDEFIRHLSIKDQAGDTAPFANKTFYLDGTVDVNIKFPIIDWAIDSKFISLLPTYQNSATNFNSTFSKFEYGPLHEKIAKIKALINDQNPSL